MKLLFDRTAVYRRSVTFAFGASSQIRTAAIRQDGFQCKRVRLSLLSLRRILGNALSRRGRLALCARHWRGLSRRHSVAPEGPSGRDSSASMYHYPLPVGRGTHRAVRTEPGRCSGRERERANGSWDLDFGKSHKNAVRSHNVFELEDVPAAVSSRLCWRFVFCKFEDAFTLPMPPSRRISATNS